MKRKVEAITIIRSAVLVWSVNLQVTLPYQWKYGWASDISSFSRPPWHSNCALLFHTWIWPTCFSLQFTFVFPFKSMAWRALSISTSKGISCTIPNWRRTQSSVCFSTSQKHTSGYLAIHKSHPAKQNTGRWPNSASYGCHTTWNSQTKGQHIMQCSIIFDYEIFYSYNYIHYS